MPLPTSAPTPQRLPLDAFAVLRSRSAADASARVGQWLSPHRLEVQEEPERLSVELNRVGLRHLSVSALRYGTAVTIDPGERGDHYLMQLPLRGRAEIRTGNAESQLDSRRLGVLLPRATTLMRWSADCDMVLLQASRDTVQRRLGGQPQPVRAAVSASRDDPGVAAWWRAAEDLVMNLDLHGQHWLRHPAALASLEEFLLAAFTSLLQPYSEPAPAPGSRTDSRCLQRAKDYIHGHLDRALMLEDIAQAACVCPRTLESVFKRHLGLSPLSYARQARLQAVHRALQTHQGTSVTDVALSHGFAHMGRFAAQYRQQFGCPPSHTWRNAH